MTELIPIVSPSGSSAATRPPRLVIREIILQDFKSYGGRRVIGPFHECFSAIIGPNGSGKSNVIDALMFVFGKKAKKIRLSKLSELIHNPQKGSQRPLYARVEVIFHEIQDVAPGQYETVPGSELVVAREVSQNNASKYIVNGRISNWTDVTKLFESKGIDLEHNRFLILQGEVEQIAMMKPIGDGQHEEGLLEYLEDLIGSNQFIESINEKTKQFNEFSELRNDHIHRVKQAEKEKDQLEGPRQEAEMYVKAASDMLEAKCLLSMIQRYQMDKKIEETRLEINEAAQLLDSVNEQIDKVSSEGRLVESSHEEKIKERDQYDDAAKKASAAFNEFDRRDAEIHTQIRNTEEKMVRQKKLIETETKMISKLSSDFAEFESSVVPKLSRELEILAERFDRENETLDSMYESVHSMTYELKAEKEGMELKAGEVRQRLDGLKSEKKLLVAERQVLLDKQAKAEELVAKSQRGIRDLEEKIELRQNEVNEAKSTKNIFTKKLDETRKMVNDKTKEYEVCINQLTNLKGKVESAKANYESLTGGVSKAGGGLAQLHHRILKESEKGKLRGVYGRLGDLCDIDSKYDVALSVALSSHMESVVVDKTSDAQSVVEFVKKHNLGRVTCIILEIVNGNIPSSNNSPLPRIIDLISVKNEKLLPAFFFAFRDTMVAENIDVASEVGLGGSSSDKRRYRVVTLSGQIVEPSGAITGGGNVSQLRSASTSRGKSSAIDQAEKEVLLAQADYEKVAVKFENIRNEKEVLFRERDSLEKSLDQISQVLSNSDEIEQFQEQLDAERKRVAAIHIPKLTEEEFQQVGVISKKIDSIETRIKPVQDELDSAEKAIDKITDKIVNIAGEKTRNQKRIVDEAGEEVEGKKKEVGRAQVDKNKIELKITKAKETISDCETELVDLAKKLETEKSELKSIEESAEQVLFEFNKFKQLVLQANGELGELSKRHGEFKAKIIELRKKNLEILNEIEKVENVKKDYEAKSKEFSKQVSSVRKEFKALPHELVELNADEREERETRQLRAVPSTAGESQPAVAPTSSSTIKALIGDLAPEEIEQLSPPEIQTNFVRLEAKMTKLQPNVKAIEDYRQKLKEYKLKKKEMESVCEQRDEVRKALEFLRQERLSMFMAGFNVITLKVKEMYQMLTLGGDAELELVDTTDPFAKGISFSVRPPKKTWKAITQLSGGEKTLSSLSLVFALHYFKPTPLYFLDEIDAALDTRNVSIIANYIKQRATDAQFIIISLRNHMFEIADWLVGIYKTNHVSKSVTLDPGAASEGLAAFKPTEARPFYAQTPDTRNRENVVSVNN